MSGGRRTTTPPGAGEAITAEAREPDELSGLDALEEALLELEPGRYEYKFVIDGGAVWEPDAGNPETVGDNHGGENSVLVVP